MLLKDLPIGATATILQVGGAGALRQHFLDMGVIPGANITLVKFAPMGDPIEFIIHGYSLTLRVDDAAQIEVSAPLELGLEGRCESATTCPSVNHAAGVAACEGCDEVAEMVARAEAAAAAGEAEAGARPGAGNAARPAAAQDGEGRTRAQGAAGIAGSQGAPEPRERRGSGGAFATSSQNGKAPRRATSPGRARTATPTRATQEHPGLGEGGRFHSRATEHPLPADVTLTFALVGNQNCGKTTLFNRLTGSNQHVGNFPGVTVDRKDGPILGQANTRITDLPGIYSMSPYTSEEIVTRQFILDEAPRGIINIVDATNIERNLYLTMQLMEMGRPMVLALNMMDEVRGNGGSIDINKMERMLGIPVVPISAAKNEGIEELVAHAVHVARYQEPPAVQDFCAPGAAERPQEGAIHRCVHAIMHLIADHAQRAHIPLRFAASKLAEGDAQVAAALKLDANEAAALEHIICQMEAECGMDRAAAIADMRFAFIGRVARACVVKPRESREHARSAKIDRVLTGKYTAIPAFVAIMALVFWLTFNVIGAALQDALEALIDWAGEGVAGALEAADVNPVVQSLVIDGIWGGVGTVLSFLPIIVTLFFFLSLLEDSGYIARVAFVMDKLLRKIGLSGRSIVPMLIGFGCTVPGVMATRTLPSERDRKMTILLTPFMSCTAKLPIYAFFTAVFFPDHGGLVMICLYLLGICIGILMALLMKGTIFRGEAVPFVMELPNYRMPGAKNVAQLLWDKARDFLQRAFTVIFLATIIIWFLQTFTFGLDVAADSQDSILATLAGLVAPVLAPLGLDDWRIATALISGFMAKESVVSTLSVLFGGTGAVLAALTPLAAACMLVFCLLYTPCVAAIASVRRELGGRWAVGVVVAQCTIAWLVAFVVRLVGLALGLG